MVRLSVEISLELNQSVGPWFGLKTEPNGRFSALEIIACVKRFNYLIRPVVCDGFETVPYMKRSLVFSPSSVLCFKHSTHHPRVSECADMEKSLVTLEKGTSCSAWNYCGQRLATGSDDGSLAIFDSRDPASSSSLTCSSKLRVSNAFALILSPMYSFLLYLFQIENLVALSIACIFCVCWVTNSICPWLNKSKTPYGSRSILLTQLLVFNT